MKPQKHTAHPKHGVAEFGEWQARRQREGWKGSQSAHPNKTRTERHKEKQRIHAKLKGK
jgi:hypothetical protein